ncbi:unnamed protein product [Chrysoparadoxa australica]
MWASRLISCVLAAHYTMAMTVTPVIDNSSISPFQDPDISNHAPVVAEQDGLTVPGRADASSGLCVRWADLSLEIKGSDKARLTRREHVLKDVFGAAQPGRLLALIGPSGCGKTSLINCLAGQVPAAGGSTSLSGSVLINGLPLEAIDQQRCIAYVRQAQHFYPYLTVRETLSMSAGMMCGELNKWERTKLVEALLVKLGLSQAAESLMGDDLHATISGGERSTVFRLDGTAVFSAVTAPICIFLDEPTSGLDAFQAQRVMETLRALADDGHTVVVSIHQPRSSIFSLIDDVLLLSEGQVMYHGEASGALAYFDGLGYKCPSNFNPADFLVTFTMRSITSAQASSLLALLSRLNYFTVAAREAWHKQQNGQEGDGRDEGEQDEGELDFPGPASGGMSGGSIKEEMKRQTRCLADAPSLSLTQLLCRSPGSSYSLMQPDKSPATSLTRPFFLSHRQAGLLFKRSWKQATRDRFALAARAVTGAALGGIFGSIFWKLGLSEASIHNRISLLVNCCINTAMMGCIRQLQLFATERPVIAAEKSDQGYSMLAYFLTKVLSELPVDMVFPLVFGPVLYKMAGLREEGLRMGKFLGITALSPQSLVCQCLSYLAIHAFLSLSPSQHLPSHVTASLCTAGPLPHS